MIRRPRHATIVAYVALFVALGGTSYAAAKFTSEDIRDESLTTFDIKDASLLLRDFDPAERASLRGPAGADGAVEGYAAVLADGTLESGRSKGVASVQRAGNASYCLDLDFAAEVASVTVRSRAGAVVGQAIAGDPDAAAAMGCDAQHSDAVVNTFLSQSGNDAPAAFYALFE